MTREDILRELELLPVWQLRKQPDMVKAEVHAHVEAAPIAPEPIQAPAPAVAVAATEYLVLCEPLEAQAQLLLNNMLASIGLKDKHNTQVLYWSAEVNANMVAQSGAKVVLAFGQAVAQQVLSTSEALPALRGKLHALANASVIVTFHPAYLLRRPQDKALAWEDLCLAKQCMQGG